MANSKDKNKYKSSTILLVFLFGICFGVFMGGTTAIASIKTNRNFIGIELEGEYVNIASQRIQKQKGDGIPPTSKEVGILPKII